MHSCDSVEAIIRYKIKTISFLAHLNIFYEYQQSLKVLLSKFLHVSEINGVIFLTIWTNIFVDEVSLALQNTDAFSMEPVLAFIAADIEPES